MVCFTWFGHWRTGWICVDLSGLWNMHGATNVKARQLLVRPAFTTFQATSGSLLPLSTTAESVCVCANIGSTMWIFNLTSMLHALLLNTQDTLPCVCSGEACTRALGGSNERGAGVDTIRYSHLSCIVLILCVYSRITFSSAPRWTCSWQYDVYIWWEGLWPGRHSRLDWAHVWAPTLVQPIPGGNYTQGYQYPYYYYYTTPIIHSY